MDSIFPSAGAYKLNVHVNGIPLDECSFIGFDDEIHPFFEESVSKDPDVSGLILFLRNSLGETAGRKIVYSIKNHYEKDSTVILVKSLDGKLPFFLLPDDLPVGQYTMVSNVISGDTILQRTEMNFFYLGSTAFSYNGINVNLPGVKENNQLIPCGLVVMLEADVDFDHRLDPYIVWYSGRTVISEGNFSDGAGQLFWQAPSQSGFFSFHAEVFPVYEYKSLAGYKKGTSLLVSFQTENVNLVSADIPNLLHWYVFAGDLSDSKNAVSAGRELNSASAASFEQNNLKSVNDNIPNWMSANGTYGLASGLEHIYAFPGIMIPDNKTGTWQALFRFKPLNEGEIFSVQFESSDVSINVYIEDQNLILAMTSPLRTVSQYYSLPDRQIETASMSDSAETAVLQIIPPRQDEFLTAGLIFSVSPGLLSAKINIIGDFVDDGGLTDGSISIETEVKDEFKILLGFNRIDNPVVEELTGQASHLLTAIWDEFALFFMPPAELAAADVIFSSSE